MFIFSDKSIKECSVKGCNSNENNDTIYSENSKFGRILCNKHYLQMFNNGFIREEQEPLICEYCGATEKETPKMYSKDNQYDMVLCNKHYLQLNQNGKLTRTKYDPNKIIKLKDYAIVEIYDKNQNIVGRVKIDLEDIDLIRKYKWSLNNGYAENGSTSILMHRLILDFSDNEQDLVTDHINNDKLDNRKQNLRKCTQAKNTINRSLMSNNTSGVTGVSFYNNLNKWVAEVKLNGKKVFFKVFDSFEEAVRARKTAEIKYFGEFRKSFDPFKEEIE